MRFTLTANAPLGSAAVGRFDIRSNGGGEVRDLAGFTLTKTGGSARNNAAQQRGRDGAPDRSGRA